MKVQQTKMLRFTEIVQKKGQPEPLVLWGEPENYPQLKRAIRENRVMTLIQEPLGNKKDVASVGFLKQKNASYLIFPKPLTEYQDRRIVGLKYDLLAEPKSVGREVKLTPKAIKKPTSRPRVEAQKPAPEPLKPKPLPRFEVTIRAVTEREFSVAVEARNRKEAERAALNLVEARGPDVAEVKPSLCVVCVRRK